MTTSIEQRESVIAEALTWRGTPFRDCARIKGQRGGVDCGQFLYAVFSDTGVSAGMAEPARYNLQYMLNCRDELYIAELLKYCKEIRSDQATRADIFMLRWGNTYSHGGILLEPWAGRIIHALNPFGILESDAKRDARILATVRKYPQSPPRFFRPTSWCE